MVVAGGRISVTMLLLAAGGAHVCTPELIRWCQLTALFWDQRSYSGGTGAYTANSVLAALSTLWGRLVVFAVHGLVVI